nr:adenylyl cyclase [Ipomoea batatas]
MLICSTNILLSSVGDVDSLWKIEKIRSESTKHHTISSAFSCAKGLLIGNKPEEAAAIIQVFYESLPDSKRPSIVAELQKLATEWPLEVVKRQKEESRKELASILQNGVPAMINALSSIGANVKVNTEDLTREGVLS